MMVTARTRQKLSLVLADVDGTLVTSEKVLTARASAAVKALDATGIAFAITSGRPPRGMAMLIDPLALRTEVAGFNGGNFVKPDMTIVEAHVLAADAAKRALSIRGSRSTADKVATMPHRPSRPALTRSLPVRQYSARTTMRPPSREFEIAHYATWQSGNDRSRKD